MMHRICLLTLTFARHAVLTVTLDLYINSDLIQTRVIGRPNLRLTKLSAEIYFGDLQKLQKTRFLKWFMDKSYLRQLEALVHRFPTFFSLPPTFLS